MTAEDVLAVVVSYNGRGKTRQAVDALRPQVGHVYIVDNGSAGESLDVLESLERQPSVSVERLGVNRGVGHALNLGVKRARQLGCAWLLTMDQDSVVDGAMVQAYQTAIAEDSGRACLAPRIANDSRKQAGRSGAIGYAITSGNLVRVSVFDQVGLYDEGFFIDCVDFDFCLRLRRAGHAVHRVPDAVMRHQLGEDVEVPGFVRPFYSLHPPARRYYMYRNFMYLAERYLLSFPLFIVKLGILQVVLLPLIAVFDKNPLQSFRGVFRGIWDYLARRTGPYGERTR